MGEKTSLHPVRDASSEKAYAEPLTASVLADPVVQYMTAPQLDKAIARTRTAMQKAAKELDFMEAARLRDEMFALQKLRATRQE